MKLSSELPPQPPRSRIIAAEALVGVQPVDLQALVKPVEDAPRRLTARDFSNALARQAYDLGWKRGREQGERAGLAQGRTEATQAVEGRMGGTVEAVAARLDRAVDGVQQQLQALPALLADELAILAIAIAREVLRREPGIDPAGLLPAAHEALSALGEGASALEIHMHPDDAARLGPHLEVVQSGRCRLRDDASLPPGGCRIESDTGSADAGLAARWQAVMDRLGHPLEPSP